MPKRGFFFDLSDGIENNSNVHREIIRRIERMTRRNLVCYIANPGHPGGVHRSPGHGVSMIRTVVFRHSDSMSLS